MIKATSNVINNRAIECRVELTGSGKEVLKEYKAITFSVYESLCEYMPEGIAKDVLMQEVNRAVMEGDHEDIKDYNR